MWPRLSIVAGLLAGVAVAGVVLGAIVLLSPPPSVPVAAATPAPSPVASATAAAGESPSVAPSGPPEPSAPASASAGAPASSSPGASAETLFHIGEPAPALLLPKVGGGTVDLAALNGSPVWVNFMATSSAPSVDEFPLMNGYATRYADNGLVVIAVDVKDDAATAAAFAEQVGATFPMALDTDGSAAVAWGASDLPVHYFIDAEGIVRDAASGGIGSDIMARGVTSILPGVDVQP
jgi:thiol-disulfide isomerase/thioredoxin